MPLRTDIGGHARVPRRGDAVYVELDEGAPSVGRPLAHHALESPLVKASASTDCVERVADVLQKLGYGFAMIPRGKSAPQHN